jgi:arginyl-tRNA synthetase
MIIQTLTDITKSALESAGFSYENIEFEHPTELTHGDYSTNVALILGKREGKNPRDVAESIKEHIKEHEHISSVDIAGPGFINFTLSRIFFQNSIKEISEAGEQWGSNTSMKGKKVLVEHTQPNPFKPFHIGHLMSNTIGESVCRLYEFTGAEVRRANYQGDVGLHVAKALWGLQKKGGDPSNVSDLADAYVFGNSAYEDDEIAKAEITEFNKMVYEESHEIIEHYETGRRVSLEHFEDLYEILDTKFDYYFFESESVEPGRALVKEGVQEGIFVESEGAVVFKGEEHGLHTRVFINSNGLPTYETKDLGLVMNKAMKWDFDIGIITTAVEQEEYFKVLFKALSLLRPKLGEKMMHVHHGMMSVTEGKMSSRKGNVITGESLLRDVIAIMNDIVRERELPEDEKETIAKMVAVAGLKYQVLKRRAGKNIIFNPEEALSFDGNSGPYLQYAHTRGVSVLNKAEKEDVRPSVTLAPGDTTELERLFYRFPEVVERAQIEHEPHYITTYLTQLASAWNSWYAETKILDGSPESGYKLAIAEAFVHTMKNGLYLLGIQAPQKM